MGFGGWFTRKNLTFNGGGGGGDPEKKSEGRGRGVGQNFEIKKWNEIFPN